MEQKFHENQIQAICHNEGPMLVLAGPGSGKTTVILERVRRLVMQNVLPRDILVVTFSRSAAEQMRWRYERKNGEKGVVFATFHSLFFRILRREYGYDLSCVLTQKEQYDALRKILGELTESADLQETIRIFLLQYGLMKSNLTPLAQFVPQEMPPQEFRKAVSQYEAYKERQQKLDFEDMQTQCHQLLTENEVVRSAWQARYRYIMIDEFQDINPVQYAVMRLLAAPQQHLFVVGDDDQSIYAFRGASPDILLHFTQDYPQAKKVTLNINYRATQRLVAFSERAISHNQNRFVKDMRSNGKTGGRIRFFHGRDIEEEAKRLCALAKELRAGGMPWEKMALICRTNLQCASYAPFLAEERIPYQIRESLPSLHRHWITEDLLAYLALAEDETADRALLRILNKPKRYIGKDLTDSARRMPYPLLRGLFASPLLSTWQEERLQRLKEDLRQIRKRTLYEAICYIRSIIGYDEYLQDYAAYRRLHHNALAEIADEVTQQAKSVQTREQWLQRLEAIGENVSVKPTFSKGEGMCLMTMHSAKGLEFSAVFLPGLTDSKIPHEKCSATPQQVEEERRLFYVALTRAKEELVLSYAQSVYNKKTEASPFLHELGLGGV